MSKLNNKYDDLPYEKCLRYGPGALSNSELLAVIIRTGTKRHNCLEVANQVLKASGDLSLLGLRHLSYKELCSIDGIGTVKAIMLMCIGELTGRIARCSIPKKTVFSNAGEIAEYYMEELRHLEREQFMLLFLNNRCGLIKDLILSIGTVNQTIVSPRDVFIEAVKNGAVHLIMIHNHPSGDPTPSRNDIICTDRIFKAGELIGISLLDHIIIGDNSYFSFKERDILGKEF